MNRLLSASSSSTLKAVSKPVTPFIVSKMPSRNMEYNNHATEPIYMQSPSDKTSHRFSFYK